MQERLPEDEFRQRKSTEGPSGPHLFRHSQDVVPSFEDAEEFYLTMSPIATEVPPRNNTAFQGSSTQQYTMTPTIHRPISTMTAVLDKLDKAEVAKWTPRQVARWMYGAGFEPAIVDKFEENDISGAILVTLKFEDLRELDIPSFGQRTKLWEEIDQLRGSKKSAQPPSPTIINCEESDDDGQGQRKPRLVQRRRVKAGLDDIVSPQESVSFVGFEQLMPKPHKCAKGENCSRWRKQQRLIEAFKNEHPVSPMGGSFMIAGNPGNPQVAEGVRPFSEMVSSVIASSDVLGPGTPAFKQLDPSTLAQIQARDPQDNVKQFLDFQHINEPWAPEEPTTPPYEMFPPLASVPHQTLAQKARADPRRTLSKLNTNPPPRSASAMDTRTFSPGPMERVSPISPRLRNRQHTTPPTIPLKRYGTPASVSDVPYTISRFSSLPAPSREASQSVPPNMNYRPPMPLRASRRRESGNVVVLPALREQAEANTPLATQAPQPRGNSFDSGYSQNADPMFSDAVVSRAKAADPNAVSQSGWMKKRKTHMLQHKWYEHHFTLRGANLCMHKDARCRETLESINIDDYAIACSSLSSTSKLMAAMKAIGWNEKKDKVDVAAFSFQLIPEVVEKARGFRKLSLKGGETHHFAVRSRDERIDWLRELMLAKALKAKEEGGEVCVNGNMI